MEKRWRSDGEAMEFASQVMGMLLSRQGEVRERPNRTHR